MAVASIFGPAELPDRHARKSGEAGEVLPRSRRGEFRQELAARFPRRWRVPVHAIFAFAPSLSRFRNMRGKRMHRRWWLLSVLLCALLPRTAAASQNVHKCIAPGGTTTYQDSPCEDPLREAARWEAPIDPHPPAEPSTAAAPKRERDSSSSAVASRRAGTRMRSNGSASSIGTASRPSACEPRKRTATARSNASASSVPTTCSAVWTSRCEGHADEVRTATAGASAAGAGRRPRPGDGCRRSHSSPSRAHTG